MNHDAIVVGSGPAGVAAASALLRRGRKVVVLDGGLRLEPERKKVVDQMARMAPDAWTEAQLALIKEGMEPAADGIPLKRLFGSDFAFRDTARFAEMACERSDVKMSLGFGGFSNVWGAGAIPFSAHDIADWPFRIDLLRPFYRECLEEMDLAATPDDLEKEYPLYTERARPLKPSRQAASFLATLQRHRAGLKRQGITFGSSRLAVKAPDARGENGCRYCGLCLYGCPYGFIYNSAEALRALLTNTDLQYQPHVVVDRLQESAGGVTLQGRDRATGQKLTFTGRQVFLACGVLSTTAILLESLSAWDRPVRMHDSQYFLCPVVRLRACAGVETEPLHTLAQIFIEIKDPQISRHGVHLSVYTYNEMLPVALRQQAGPLARVMPGLPAALAQRLLVFGGYLHSRDSPSLELTLSHGKSGGKQILVKGESLPSADAMVKRVLRKLSRNSLRLGALPLSPFVRKGLPGRGYHVGGSFPMSLDTGPFKSDLAGRPGGFSNVYAVDATVFPSIPAPNLTLTVMANARRIADTACQV